MDAVYRGLEIAFLGFALMLALAVLAGPAARVPDGEQGPAITLSMLSVTADPATAHPH